MVIVDFLSKLNLTRTSLEIGPRFTMIDTPGFGDDLVNEERTIDELVDVLKNKVSSFFCVNFQHLFDAYL